LNHGPINDQFEDQIEMLSTGYTKVNSVINQFPLYISRSSDDKVWEHGELCAVTRHDSI